MLLWGPHAGFITASYGIAFIVLAILIGWIILDGRQQKRLLAELERRGVHRRSDNSARETNGS